jgi:hypothetical protein
MNSANRLDGDEHRDDGLFRGGEISASLTQIADHSAIRDGHSWLWQRHSTLGSFFECGHRDRGSD